MRLWGVAMPATWIVWTSSVATRSALRLAFEVGVRTAGFGRSGGGERWALTENRLRVAVASGGGDEPSSVPAIWPVSGFL